MTLIELFHQDDGHGLLDRNHPYVLRVSHGSGDDAGWVPHSAQGFDTLAELREAVLDVMNRGDFLRVRASGRFTPFASQLDLEPTVLEWRPKGETILTHQRITTEEPEVYADEDYYRIPCRKKGAA